jgi:hypothetical protein
LLLFVELQKMTMSLGSLLFSFFANSIEDDNEPRLIIVIFVFHYDVILLKQHKQQQVGHVCCPFLLVALP